MKTVTSFLDIRFLFLWVLVLLLVGCTQDRGVQPVIPIIIAKGDLIGNGTDKIGEKSFVISSTEEWNQLLSNIDSANRRRMVVLEDRVDFDKYTVLAIFDTVWMSNAGSSISVSIVENSKNVYVETVYDSADTRTLMAIQYRPYLIVKIPQTTKSVQFNTQK
ncbi:MAG: hypothetical protein H6Q17_314 [Bacteroidetes bacterium]|nr:hypothetical protein [Bacteroidota bacterium]